MKTELQKEHHWLLKLAGEWTYEGETTMSPDQPPAKYTGTESIRSLDGFWIVAEGRGEMPGEGVMTTLMTLGYDPQRKRYVGTWIASRSTELWLYEGEVDAAGKRLLLDTEGPSMTGGGKRAKYRDVMEFKSDDHRVLTSHVLGDDGEWHRFNTANYRRKR